MQGLVSIIIPTFNREDLIGETLDSVLDQIHTNWECIVVDDGSQDSTLQVLQRYAQNDDRFKIYERPAHMPKGANSCRNFGYEQSKGAFVNWFDSDDVLHPDFMEQKVKAFTDETIHATFHRNRYASFDLTIARESRFHPNSFKDFLFYFGTDQTEISINGLMWRRSFLEGKPLYNEHLSRYQDNEFNIRMLGHGPKIADTQQVLATVRVGGTHSTQISYRPSRSAKKLFDIVYYRYQSFLQQNKVSVALQKEYTNVVTKKFFWNLYEALSMLHTRRERWEAMKQRKDMVDDVLQNGHLSPWHRWKMKASIYIKAILFKQSYSSIGQKK